MTIEKIEQHLQYFVLGITALSAVFSIAATSVRAQAEANYFFADTILTSHGGRVAGVSMAIVQPPTIQPISLQSATVGQLLSFKVVASGSGALTFSASNLPSGAKYLPLGDVTINGSVSSLDSAYISQKVTGTRTFSAEETALADVNQDGTITQADADLLLNVIVGNALPLNTYVLLWTPTIETTTTVTFTVTDSASQSTNQEVTITTGSYTYGGQEFRKGETWTFRTPPVTGASLYLIGFHKASSGGWFYENYAHDRKWSYDGTWTIAPTHPKYNDFYAGEDVKVEFRPLLPTGWGDQKFVTVKITGPNPLPVGAKVLTVTTAGETDGTIPGGSIVSVPAGAINCGTDCSEVYQTTTTATIEAVPRSGFVLNKWVNGDCEGSQLPRCVVSMSKSQTATAAFDRSTTPIQPSLTASLDPSSPASGTAVIPGTVNAHMASYKLSASGGDVTVSGLTVQGAPLSPCPFANARLYVGGIQVGSTAASLDSTCSVYFTGLGLRVPTNGSTTVALKVSASSAAQVGSQLSFDLTRIETSTFVTIGSQTVSGPRLIFQNETLTASLDPNTPSARTVAPGTTGVTFLVTRLTATGGDVRVNKIRLGLRASGSVSELTNVAVWRGATQISPSTILTPNSGTIVFSTPQTIAGGQTDSWTIRADVPTGVSGEARVTLEEASGIGVVSAMVLSASGVPVVGNAMTIGTSSGQPSITLLTPNGGETWQVGKTHEVRWTFVGIPSDVQINLNLINRTPVQNIGSWSVTTSGNTGQALFTVPSNAEPGQSYEMLISTCVTLSSGQQVCGDGRNPYNTNDRSDRFFSVVAASTSQPSITLLSPNGGETWEAGKSYDIRWQGQNLAPQNGYVVLRVDRATPFATPTDVIYTEVPGNPGVYQVTVPTSVTPASDYRVTAQSCLKRSDGSLACAVPENNYHAMDTSDAPFSIIGAGGGGGGGGGGGATTVQRPPETTIAEMETKATQLKENNLDAILSELKLLRNLVQEQQTEIRYLKGLTQDLSIRSSQAEAAIKSFITYGVDENTKRLGAGERAAVMHSYKAAFDKLPETEEELADAIKIANGRWPSAESVEAEARASTEFKKVYQRDPNLQNPNDDAAVTVMAYGLRQRAENRNLKSEAKGILTFKNLYRRPPQSTEDWNIVQAITYSGAKR